MKNWLFVIGLLVIIPGVVFSEVTFKDVPSDHWASRSVYDLVKLGVTQGYPDGTFRGSNNITRYETAMFLSKLATVVGTPSVDVDALKAEIKALKEEIADLRKREEAPPILITGSYMMRYRMANFAAYNTSTGTASRESRVDYRLKTTFFKELGEGANVKVNLDTMDAGFSGGSENLATKLLDIEGNLKVDTGLGFPLAVKVTSGPGPVTYSVTQDAVFKSEVGVTYVRPRNSVTFSTSLFNSDISMAYIDRTTPQVSPAEIDVNHIALTLGQTFPDIPWFGVLKILETVDYLAEKPLQTPAGPKDTKGKISLSASPSSKVTWGIIFGMATSDSPIRGYYTGFNLTLADPFNTGTITNLAIHSVGPEYLFSPLITAEADLVGYDYFSKKIGEDLVDIGCEIIHPIADRWTLKVKYDSRLTWDWKYGEDYPSTSQTIEGAIAYDVAPATVFDAFYKVYQVPSDVEDKTTDILGVSLLYKF